MTKRRDTGSAHTGPNGPGPAPAPRQPQSGEQIFTLARDGRLQSRDEIVREVQDYFRALAPAERILSEELIAERRRAFEQEEVDSGSSSSRTTRRDRPDGR